MAELFGKATGCSKGKGGSMHFFDAARHMFGGNGIVGAQIPVATGVALKIRYRKDGGVVLCWFGDGAIHQGSFHESLNMAKIWNLPIVYICENNQYGMGTDFRRVSSVTDFAVMGASYGIPGRQVNGMDVLEVYREVSAAVARARVESTPIFLEIKTYRYRGHSMSDPAKYRTPEELESYKKQDPILIQKIPHDRIGHILRGGVRRHGRRVQGGLRRGGAVRRGEPRARAFRAVRGRVRMSVDHVPRGAARGDRRGDGPRRRASSCSARRSASTTAPTR